MFSEPASLLTTKLYMPRPRTNLVARPDLTARLDQALAHTLTLISAPAGFGKTTLVSSWIYNLQAETAGQEKIVNPARGTQAKSKIANRVAWLSLDEADNDPVRFLSYFAAALQLIQPGIGQTVLEQVELNRVTDTVFRSFDPSTPLKGALAQDKSSALQFRPSVESLLTTLINDLATIADDFVLVLDDYHLITTQAIHEALTFLLDHGPPRMHVIIVGRTEPPLPLARLRARNQLLELRTAELRFTPHEAAAFLTEVMGLELSAANIAALERRTEGWVAGLQMAALSMQDRRDVSSFIATFTGSHRYILDYLTEEVLQQQPEPVREFLLRTSILARLCGPLCDEVTQFTASEFRLRQSAPDLSSVEHAPSIVNGQTMLEYLEQANLFILPLDDERRWYRYHHLFAGCLRDQLQRRLGEPELTRLHHRAAAWYEQHGLPAEAMSHALTVADVERATRLVNQTGRSLLRRSELATLLKWLEALPEESVRSQPQLSLFRAWALVLTGQLEAVETQLAEFEQPPPAQDAAFSEQRTVSHEQAADILGEIMAVRATVAYFRQDLPQAIALYRQAFDRLPEQNLFLRGAVAMTLATAYNVIGDLAGARWAFAQGKAISEANGDIHTALVATWNLAQLHVKQAQLRRAAELYRGALQLAADRSDAFIGRLHIGLGEIFYRQNELAEADQRIRRGLAWGEQVEDAVTLVSGYLAQARLKHAQGEPKAALKLFQQAEEISRANHFSGWEVRLAVQQVKWEIVRGDLKTAARWLDKCRSHLTDNQIDDSAGYLDELRWLARTAQIRWSIAQALAGKSGAPDKPAEILLSLSSLRQTVQEGQQIEQLIEILTLQALAYQANDDPDSAMTELGQALALAEPEGYIRPFTDEGRSIAQLLERMKAEGGRMNDYIEKLLSTFEHTSPLHPSSFIPHPLIEPLSERELEILHLIAGGMSNRQIAGELVLTIGTVKWHINNIYGKLGVRRRTQAVAKARELKLL